MTLPPTIRRSAPLLLLVLVPLVISACIPGTTTDASGNPVTPTPAPPLTPAQPGVDPVSTIAWIFTPIFQVLFIILIAVYQFLENLAVPGAIAWAIVVLTLVVRSVLIPLYRRQLVSQRRMQLIQPELREIQKRYKGDAMKARLAQQELFKERGISPLSGCMPVLLQLPLLFIMYTVIQNGLTNVDPSAMLTVFGVEVVDLQCTNLNAQGVPDAALGPCIDSTVPILGDIAQPQTFWSILGIGLSFLAIISALLQLVQSRMILPAADPSNDDPNVRIQRQTMLFLPLISVFYGGLLPAGLFIYWIVATIFSIVQQYLIVGWGVHVPAVRMDPGFRRRAQPALPGRDAAATRGQPAGDHPYRSRQEDDRGEDHPPP